MVNTSSKRGHRYEKQTYHTMTILWSLYDLHGFILLYSLCMTELI